MRVLFLIPKNNAPQLTGQYSKTFKDFVEVCLNKDPENVSTELGNERDAYYMYFEPIGYIFVVKQMNKYVTLSAKTSRMLEEHMAGFRREGHIYIHCTVDFM